MPVFTESQLLEKILESKFSTEEPINLLCCVNDKFVNPMINLMYSIRHFCGSPINLYVLSTKLSDYSIDLINEKMKYLNISPTIKVVSLPNYDTHSSKWSLDVYLKVFAFEFMPKEVDKVLYLDSDMLNLNNISNIYNFDINGKYLAASIDIDVNHSMVFGRRKKLGIKHDYFNSGMLILNLKKQREDWSYEKINKVIQNNELLYPDQDLFNMLCEEKDILFVPYKYNFQSWHMLVDEKCLEVFDPSIIHFICHRKPWIERYFEKPHVRLFYECAALTHLAEYCPGEYFKDRLEKNIEYSKNDEETINLLCCINDGYVNPMINLMYSIRQYNRNKIKLFVLSTNISEDSIESINKSMKYLNIETSVQICSLPELKTECSYWTVDMYLRVLSFKYLPKEMDKILYVDVDTLAMGDIAEVYKPDIQNYVLSARREPWRFEYDKIKNSCKDNNFDHDYFSSGVLLFNLKKIREVWSEEKIFSLIKSLKLYFPDQDLLNKLCSKDDVLFMPDNHNYYNVYLMKDYDEIRRTAPIILHYPGKNKPWNVKELNIHQKYFFKSAKLTNIKEYHDNPNIKKV